MSLHPLHLEVVQTHVVHMVPELAPQVGVLRLRRNAVLLTPPEVVDHDLTVTDNK
jgi:hypothetical protein